MRKVNLLALFAIMIGSNMAYAQLPQEHHYQVVLRNYMATLDEEDFKITLKPLTVKPSYFNSIGEVYKTWLVLDYYNGEPMNTKGLQHDASHFTLDAIEAGGTVNMVVGRGEWMPVIPTAAYTEWNYEGNPYYDNKAAKLRAFVAAAVDMMMQDQDHARGNNRRSDFLGQPLIRWAFAYGAAKDILPQKVRLAYEKGLIRMFKKLEEWGPTGIHADMDMAAMVGVLYTAKFVDSVDLTQRAYAYIDLLLNKFFHKAGYIDHGGAYDGGYQGISLYFINWATHISDYRPLIDVLQKMATFKSYLTLPDPDGYWASPFHSNPSSPDGVTHDYWSPYWRDVGISYYADSNAYSIFPGEHKLVRDRLGMINLMQAQLVKKMSLPEATNSSPGTWKHEHWVPSNALNVSALYYKQGLYEKLLNLQNTNSPLTKPPFLRNKQFTESFDDKWLSAKRPTYGTIIFNDQLSWWTKEGQTENINGFGGGNISAFWTPSTGTVILGGTRAPGHGPGLDLEDWRIWPVHALSGESTGGKAFSSALQRHPEATYELNRKVPRVTITGDLASVYSDPTDVLQGSTTYKRTFELHDNGLRVTTSVIVNGSEPISSLYEIIPVYLDRFYGWGIGGKSSITKIAFEVNGNWQEPSTNFQHVSRIRLSRFNGEVYIEFSEPARVKLSAREFYQKPAEKEGMKARNIMIDMLADEDHSVTYFIRSSKAQPHNWNNDGDDGNSGSSGSSGNGGDEPKPKDTTAPDTKISISPKIPSNTQKVTFTATASDKSGIEKLVILVNGTDKKTCRSTTVCKVTLGPLSAGSHTYQSKAIDGSSQSNASRSEEKTFKVSRTPSPNTPPSDVSVALKKESTYLKADVKNVSDPDGDEVFLVYDWRVEGKSIAVVNLPFDINSINDTKTNADVSGSLKNYTTYKNTVYAGNGKSSPGWIKKGEKGGALVFDGKNDYARIEAGNAFENLQKFTIEVWIKHDNWGDEWAAIISKPYYTDSWKNPWAVFKLSRKSNTDYLNLHITVGKNKAVSLDSKQKIPANEWTHLAATYDGKDLKLYINGKLDNTLSVNKPLVTRPNTDVFIAKNASGTTNSEQYRGAMDEVRIYNVVLSKKQIKQHYQGNYDKMLLGQIDFGTQLKVAVTANDTKTYAGKPSVSNMVTISDKSDKVKANKSWLAQNYPNPFYDKTTIKYKLSKPQTITLKVYDTTGRLVKTVYKGQKAAGEHKVPFDGTHLASGIYLIVLKLEEKTITRKMTLIH